MATSSSQASSQAARQLALAALMTVAAGRAQASKALDEALGTDEGRKASSYLTDTVYGTLRHLPMLDAALAARLRDPTRLPDAVRWALRAGSYERLIRGTPPHAAVHAWVELVKTQRGPARRLASLVNAVLRTVDLADVHDDAASHGLTPELWQELRSALGDVHAGAAADAMMRPSPLWLTVLRPEATAALEAEGVSWRPGPLPGSLAVRPGRSLGELQAFTAGMVQPQNPSSAAVVLALGAVSGRRVLDVGAGHGVKTAQLAAAGADVVAVELEPRRSRTGERNLRRLGLSATHVVADAAQPLDALPMTELALLDAPCTGTGTLRGHPEIRLRWNQEHAASAATLQAAMLRSVAERVLPGGVLVYAVCALGIGEGPGVVEGFLGERDDWTTELPELPLPLKAASVGGWILPDEAGLDGFYLVRLRRQG